MFEGLEWSCREWSNPRKQIIQIGTLIQKTYLQFARSLIAPPIGTSKNDGWRYSMINKVIAWIGRFSLPR
jgi:hypothetical protein